MVEQSGDPASAWVQADGLAYREAPNVRYGARLDVGAAEALFAGAPRGFAEIRAEADREGGRPKGFALVPRALFSRESELYRYESPNVVGLLPGSDPALAKEVVVLMAHLDHLGPIPGDKGDRIRNGALDNAAGIAAMLEAARALAGSSPRPRRSILFAAVTGEEQGLLGSQFLARHPVVAGATVVAVVNLDAPILLYDFVDVIAFGAEHSTLGPIVARATARAGIRSSPDPLPEQGLFTRSDHYSFVKEGVPGVFLVTGFANGGEKFFREYLTSHYHRPSDQLDLPIHWGAAAKFARVNYLIASEIANEPARPLWYEDSLFGNAYAPKAAKAKR
jgi:Zn-dependent M28 family amino/carboxypeptidase